MDLLDIRFLFGYDRWATQKVLAAAADIDVEVWGATGVVGERGLGTILVHLLGAHQRWRNGIARTGQVPRPELEPLPSSAELSIAWAAEWSAFDEFLDTLTQPVLDHVHEGVAVSRMLLHLANHGTQHRSEAALLLTEAGRPPGDLDLIDYAEALATGRLIDPANS
jgi:uncharacterized damage-inducible protein DinB